MQTSSRGGLLRLTCAATAMTVVGMLPINLLPILVNSWVDSFGATPGQAGRIAATELGLMAVASIVLSFGVHRAPRRLLAIAAGLGTLVVHLASFRLEGESATGGAPLSLLLGLRGIAGLCEGVLLGTVAATISAFREPERLYAWVAISGSVAALAMWAGVPILVSRFGAAGAFAAMAGIVGIGLPLFLWIPQRTESHALVLAGDSDSGGIGRAGVLLAIAGVAVAAGQGAVWSFSGRIATLLAFSPSAIAATFGAATMAGTLGAGLAAWIGLERGRFLPLAFGYVGILAAIALITADPSTMRFMTGQILFALSYFFVSPYVMGLAAELDRSGRIASRLSGALLVGAGIGPALGGWVLENSSFAMLGFVGMGLTMIPGALLVLDPELRRGVTGPSSSVARGDFPLNEKTSHSSVEQGGRAG